MKTALNELKVSLAESSYIAPQAKALHLEIESPILGQSVDNFEGDTGHAPNTEDFLNGGTISWP